MAVTLTSDAITQLSGDDWQKIDAKPVLQVTEIRMVQTQSLAVQQKERYRVTLSDGLCVQQGMLGIHLDDCVTSQRLQIGSILQLDEFVCTQIRGRVIIIILSFSLIADNCDIIGDPSRDPIKFLGNKTFSM